MRNGSIAPWLVLCALIVLAGGCKKSDAPGGSSPGVEAPSQETNQARSLYAKGFNILLDDPSTMIKEFFEKVPEEGIVGERKITLFPRHNFGERKIDEAEKAFFAARGVGSKETAPLEPIATTVIAEIKKVLSIFKEAHRYYDAEDYKDDKGAKGKKLHAQMRQAAAGFHKAFDQLSDKLSALEDKQSMAEISKYEAKKGPSYWFRYFNFKAKKALDVTRNAERYNKAFAQVEAAYQGMDAWQKSAGEVKPIFKSYLNMADKYYGQAKKLKRRMDEAATNKATPQAVGREAKMLVQWYNNLVSMSNSLHQMEAQGLL
jgi:hypothetical protein